MWLENHSRRSRVQLHAKSKVMAPQGSLTAADVARHLPLRPVACAVLAALAHGPRAGIDVLDAVNATVPGRPILGPGSLYRLLRELRQEKLIARGDPDERPTA